MSPLGVASMHHPGSIEMDDSKVYGGVVGKGLHMCICTWMVFDFGYGLHRNLYIIHTNCHGFNGILISIIEYQ